jgi:tetratricopeptide (TPR) repeat protein/transcriptional regulator with XRE-family HTH domain
MPAHNGSQRAEQRKLRERMRGLGMTYGEIAAEMGRRYKLRPRAAWRIAWGWTLEEAAERYNMLRAKDETRALTSLTGSRLSEWENWPFSTRKPSILSLCLLAEIYQASVLDLIDFDDREKLSTAELLALDKPGTDSARAERSAHRPGARTPDRSAQFMKPSEPIPPGAPALANPPIAAGPVRESLMATPWAVAQQEPTGGIPAVSCLVPEWTAWFGFRLAHLITLTDRWHDPAQLSSLQSLLDQEIFMSDAVVPDDQRQSGTFHALSRRQALMTLAALPTALVVPSTVSDSVLSPAAGTDFFLARCAASLASCWHLLRGSDLPAVERFLSAYLLPLEGVAQQPSRYQIPAARLATQAHRICGILALHHNQLSVREHHCKRALQYAAISADASSHASALISLASTYFYASDPQQAAAVYEQAFRYGTALPALQRSRVYAELAVAYGQLGREQDAIHTAGQARELYPDCPEDDPSFLYAEFTPASMALEQGLAHLALAGHFPDRGYQQQAAEIFGLAGQSAWAIPERIRFEIVNHQAETAVLLGDLDAFEGFMSCGLDGITLLGSRQRLKEMQATWHRAIGRWPGERRLKALAEGLRHAPSADEQS